MPQDQNTSASWSQNMHPDSLGGDIGEEDFTKFLDLDNGFDQFQQMDSNSGHSSLETPMGRLAFGHNPMPNMAGYNQDLINTMDIPQYQSYQMYQQINTTHQYQIPPTPVSAEMLAGKYTGPIDNAGQIIFERHQASFTPLVSPAQTPLENAFSMSDLPDYIVSDDFFSPLTSPAIEAQPNFASTNATASPVDLNADQSASNTPTSAVRKRGRKANATQQRPARSVKQSPAMKPQQKKRQYSHTPLPHEILETMVENSGQEGRLQLDAGRAVFMSSEDSVSPEPLSESLMRPPPVPSNVGRSPSGLRPKTTEQNLPATPAMIMRMPSKQVGSADDAINQIASSDVMEDITLPDAAAALSSKYLSPIDTRIANSEDQSTPTLSAKTPKLSIDSTPRMSAIKTNNNSSESIDKMKRPEAKHGGRSSKKRQSVSSTTISPALRPKISPSISPLVPAPGPGMTGMSAETSALFLASKSNYQNILDGTHLPGVSYPEALAENLSSKRTSHKIAEQGRRNRINLALKEIESLLPPSILTPAKKEKGAIASKDSEEGSPDKQGSAGQGASKASTVEMAIVYIKSLQAELKETKEKLETAEQTIARGNTSDAQSSE